VRLLNQSEHDDGVRSSVCRVPCEKHARITSSTEGGWQVRESQTG
jgi:hypothetical protein